MAGRRGARGLTLALAVAVAGFAALSQMSLAEAGSSQGVRTAQDETVTAVADPVAATPQTPVGLPEEQVQAITRAQRCLAELGYYKGENDGKRGQATWTAYWHFKHDHDLAGYKDLTLPTVQKKMGELCKAYDTTAAITPAATSPTSEPGPAAPATGEERASL